MHPRKLCFWGLINIVGLADHISIWAPRQYIYIYIIMSSYASQTIFSFTSKVSQGLHYLTLGLNASYHDVQSRSSPGVALVCTWSKTSGKRRCTQIASRLKYAITYRVKKIFTKKNIQSGDTIINRSVVSSHIFMKIFISSVFTDHLFYI